VWPDALDPETGKPTSAAFKQPDMSLDVASLCAVDDSRRRMPSHYWAVLSCRWFVDRGYRPEHRPIVADAARRISENLAHAEVPGKLKGKHPREIAALITDVYPPISPKP